MAFARIGRSVGLQPIGKKPAARKVVRGYGSVLKKAMKKPRSLGARLGRSR